MIITSYAAIPRLAHYAVCQFRSQFVGHMHCIDMAYYCYITHRHIYLSVCVSVCLLGTWVSFAKMAESTEMPFGRLTHVCPRNHVLDGGQDPSTPFVGSLAH